MKLVIQKRLLSPQISAGAPIRELIDAITHSSIILLLIAYVNGLSTLTIDGEPMGKTERHPVFDAGKGRWEETVASEMALQLFDWAVESYDRVICFSPLVGEDTMNTKWLD